MIRFAIRFLLLLALFCAGLAGAALWKGQMHHLRLALPDRLPDWTTALPDDAGVIEGNVALPLTWLSPLPLPAANLRWRAGTPSAEGLRWTLALTGPGLDLRGEAVLPWRGDRVLLRNGTGTLDLAAASGGQIGGLVAIDALQGAVADPWAERRPSATLAARVRGLAAEGASLGEGPLTGRLDDDGGFALDLRLSGGVTEAEATLSGQWPANTARLTARITDASALPPRLRQVLQRAGTPEGAGLRIDMTLGE